MSVNIKKDIVEPIASKIIKVPSVKDIVALKSSGTYDKFNELVTLQTNVLKKNITRLAIWAIMTAASGTTAIYEYYRTKSINSKFNDDSERIINEAIADNEINK